MDAVSYNLLMDSVKKLTDQTSLLFSACDSTGPSGAEHRSPEQILKSVFGYDSFRPHQREIIQNVLDGRDTLAIMPTGGGKSLCYQIPALMMPGLTVVISPLIALMQDQVAQLKSAGIEASFLNSSMEWSEYLSAMERIKGGGVKLLYVSPEGLNSAKVRDLLNDGNISVDCITIDEAHCISEWGHDFRPDYMEIAEIRKQFPRAVCLALTATATEQVRKDIIRNLRMESPAELVASFDRPNIYLDVRRKKNISAQVLDFIMEHKGQSGIVYCFSRKQVDDLTDALRRAHIKASNYHAGLSDQDRAEHQSEFIKDKTDIMIATIAFGMGINKPNVRFVIHTDLPKSIEQYYQEIGRAGRDGLPATALLLYGYGDVHKIRYFFSGSADPEKSERLLQEMVGYAQSRMCRRRKLLAYFGEHSSADGPQGTDLCCDICAYGAEEGNDVTIPAQKFISCVLRTGERFGASYIADVLMGSGGRRILENRHNGLSTWGIGKDLRRSAWLDLSEALVQDGYLFKTMEHSVLRVTEKGSSALRNRSEIILPVNLSARPEPLKTKGVSVRRAYAAEDEESSRIATELRVWRRKTADEENIPPYVIFGDKTLFDIAEKKPASLNELRNCYGIGELKAQRFGSSVLRIVRGEY